MQTFEHTFTLLRYLGVWSPEEWPSGGWKTNIYYCYTLFVMVVMGTVIFSEFVGLMNKTDDVEEVANNAFLLMSVIASSIKAVHVIIKRRDIIALMDVLRTNPCRPQTEAELAIQYKFDSWIRSTAIRYWTMAALILAAFILRSFVIDTPQRTLPYEAWIPFEWSESLLGYSILYGQQTLGVFYGCEFGVVLDSLVAGLMLQTCCQLHILKHRFHEIPHIMLDNDRIIKSGNNCNPLNPDLESNLLSQCVEHHLEIFKFAKTSNDLFAMVILIQYAISSLILCSSLLSFSRMTLFSSEFTATFMYAAFVGVQIYVYCYCGYEVTLESLTVGDAIYASNWGSLSIKAQRSLHTIMTRTMRPIEFTSANLLTLNLEYFTSLLKVTYSVYNVLQQSSE